MNTVKSIIIGTGIKNTMLLFQHLRNRSRQISAHSSFKPLFDRVDVGADKDRDGIFRQKRKLLRFRYHIKDVLTADGIFKFFPE